jgi:hypothetical protein
MRLVAHRDIREQDLAYIEAPFLPVQKSVNSCSAVRAGSGFSVFQTRDNT